MKNFMRAYLNDEYKLKGKDLAAILCATAVFGGIFGMLYETLFYVLNDGGICRRGTSFGPWIEIYGIGAILIFFLTYKFKKKLWQVLLISGVGCGVLEYIAGYAIFLLFDGRRGWNYNTEIMSWGGEFTNGFVCLRSVCVFAGSGLFLIYVVVPFFVWLYNKGNKKVFLIIAGVLAAIFALDVIYNDVIVSIFDTYSAGDFYKEWGAQTGFYIKYNEDWLIQK